MHIYSPFLATKYAKPESSDKGKNLEQHKLYSKSCRTHYHIL